MFDVSGAACVKMYLVYNLLHSGKRSFLDCKLLLEFFIVSVTTGNRFTLEPKTHSHPR